MSFFSNGKMEIKMVIGLANTIESFSRQFNDSVVSVSVIQCQMRGEEQAGV